jgi:hypothetical protein
MSGEQVTSGVETLQKLFGDSARVLVKDGEFNDVQGEYHHHDYSQRITNNGCYNIIGNTIHNVGNICPRFICMCLVFGFDLLTNTFLDPNRRDYRSMQHGRVVSSSVDASGI